MGGTAQKEMGGGTCDFWDQPFSSINLAQLIHLLASCAESAEQQEGKMKFPLFADLRNKRGWSMLQAVEPRKCCMRLL